jgi:hypothetical protein
MIEFLDQILTIHFFNECNGFKSLYYYSENDNTLRKYNYNHKNDGIYNNYLIKNELIPYNLVDIKLIKQPNPCQSLHFEKIQNGSEFSCALAYFIKDITSNTKKNIKFSIIYSTRKNITYEKGNYLKYIIINIDKDFSIEEIINQIENSKKKFNETTFSNNKTVLKDILDAYLNSQFIISDVKHFNKIKLKNGNILTGKYMFNYNKDEIDKLKYGNKKALIWFDKYNDKYFISNYKLT